MVRTGCVNLDGFSTAAAAAYYTDEKNSPVSLLVGADLGINTQIECYGTRTNPLFIAVAASKPKGVESLLLHGADSNVEIQQRKLQTPLVTSIEAIHNDRGNPAAWSSIVKLLVKSGADINAPDSNG